MDALRPSPARALARAAAPTLAAAPCRRPAPLARPPPGGAMPRPAPPPPASARRRRCARLAAVAAAGAAAAADPLPESREEAVAQAAAAVAAQMAAPKGARNRKQRGSAAAAELALPGFAAAPKRLSVEIPVADESAAGAVALARELVAALPGALSRQFTVVAAGEGDAAGAGGAGAPVVALARCLAEGRAPAGGLVVAAPAAAQAADVAALLAAWRGAAVVVLNPGWAAAAANDALSPAYDFAQTFDPVYAFQPIAIAGLARAVVAEEGAVFRWARSGESGAAPASSSASSAGFGAATEAGDDDLGAAPWRVYVRGKSGAWEPVARMRRRPGEAEVEAAFYNAAAAASPITKGAKWLRGLVDKKK